MCGKSLTINVYLSCLVERSQALHLGDSSVPALHSGLRMTTIQADLISLPEPIPATQTTSFRVNSPHLPKEDEVIDQTI